MTTMIEILRVLAILICAGLIGNTFLKQSRANRAQGKSPLAVFKTFPGVIVILAVLLPILVWWIRH